MAVTAKISVIILKFSTYCQTLNRIKIMKVVKDQKRTPSNASMQAGYIYSNALAKIDLKSML